MDKKYTPGRIIYIGALKVNPVLVQCVALCPVIVATQNLRDAFFISLALIADLVVSAFVASTVIKKMPRFLRVALYLIIGIVIICPVMWFIEFRTLINLSLTMKIFLPLVAINSATAVHCETFAVKNKMSVAVYDALAAGLGIALVMLLCGALREIIGSGTLLGYTFNFKFTLPAMTMPAGCLVLLGFAAAVHQKIFGAGIKKEERDTGTESPEEVEIDIYDEEPEAVDIDLTFEDDDEYAYLLSSVNELIASFSGDGEEDDGE